MGNGNLLCKRSNLTNEASVETWFADKLLALLGFGPEDVNLKTSIKEYRVGQGSKSSWYKPDYVVLANKFPAWFKNHDFWVTVRTLSAAAHGKNLATWVWLIAATSVVAKHFQPVRVGLTGQ
jgi:hypothetical protein